MPGDDTTAARWRGDCCHCDNRHRGRFVKITRGKTIGLHVYTVPAVYGRYNINVAATAVKSMRINMHVVGDERAARVLDGD